VQGIVTSSFGSRLDPFNGEGAFHTGIDIATAKGEAVRAPADGTVLKAGMGNGYGREVVIDHGHGIQTIYAHLSGFAVTEGQDVSRGDILGYVGSSGHSTGPHLHYEVRIHDTPVNPSKYLHAATRQLASTPSAPTPTLAPTSTPTPTVAGGGSD
jgi:murein DD-endopeptidase MepM/ murein hydrolase activator NlpD